MILYIAIFLSFWTTSGNKIDGKVVIHYSISQIHQTEWHSISPIMYVLKSTSFRTFMYITRREGKSILSVCHIYHLYLMVMGGVWR